MNAYWYPEWSLTAVQPADYVAAWLTWVVGAQ